MTSDRHISLELGIDCLKASNTTPHAAELLQLAGHTSTDSLLTVEIGCIRGSVPSVAGMTICGYVRMALTGLEVRLGEVHWGSVGPNCSRELCHSSPKPSSLK